MSTVTKAHRLSITKSRGVVTGVKYNPCTAEEIDSEGHSFYELLDTPCNLDNMVALEVTVAQAMNLLDNFNNCNRAIKKSRVDLYAERMRDGEWINANPLAPLAFFEDGNVATGQHRLAAQIVANMTITYAVAFGVTEEQREVMDEESHTKVDKILMQHRVTAKAAKSYLEAPRFIGLAGRTRYTQSDLREMEIKARLSISEEERDNLMGLPARALIKVSDCMNAIPTGRNVKKGLISDGILVAAYYYLMENHNKATAVGFIRSLHLCKEELTPTPAFDNNCFRTLVLRLKSLSNEFKETPIRASIKSATKAAVVGKYLQMFTAERHTESLPAIGYIHR